MPIDFRNVVNLRNGQFDSTTRAQMDQLFDGCLADGTGKLAVHFHGGLVSERDAMALAERLLPEDRQTNVAYPMFFVWESALLEILRNNVGEILRENFFQILLRHALSFVAGKVRQQIVGGRIAAVTPESVSRVAGGTGQGRERRSQLDRSQWPPTGVGVRAVAGRGHPVPAAARSRPRLHARGGAHLLLYRAGRHGGTVARHGNGRVAKDVDVTRGAGRCRARAQPGVRRGARLPAVASPDQGSGQGRGPRRLAVP